MIRFKSLKDLAAYAVKTGTSENAIHATIDIAISQGWVLVPAEIRILSGAERSKFIKPLTADTASRPKPSKL